MLTGKAAQQRPPEAQAEPVPDEPSPQAIQDASSLTAGIYGGKQAPAAEGNP